MTDKKESKETQSGLTVQPLQEVWTEDSGQMIERETFQVDAGVQHFQKGARLKLGEPGRQNAFQLLEHLARALMEQNEGSADMNRSYCSTVGP